MQGIRSRRSRFPPSGQWRTPVSLARMAIVSSGIRQGSLVAAYRSGLSASQKHGRSQRLWHFLRLLGVFPDDGEPGRFQSDDQRFRPTQDNGQTFTATVSESFSEWADRAIGSNWWLETNLGQNITFFPRDRKAPYAQRWSFGVQQEMKLRDLFWNPPTLATAVPGCPRTATSTGHPRNTLSTSPTRDQATISFLGALSFRIPFFGTNPQYTGTISRANLLTAVPAVW